MPDRPTRQELADYVRRAHSDHVGFTDCWENVADAILALFPDENAERTRAVMLNAGWKAANEALAKAEGTIARLLADFRWLARGFDTEANGDGFHIGGYGLTASAYREHLAPWLVPQEEPRRG